MSWLDVTPCEKKSRARSTQVFDSLPRPGQRMAATHLTRHTAALSRHRAVVAQHVAPPRRAPVTAATARAFLRAQLPPCRLRVRTAGAPRALGLLVLPCPTAMRVAPFFLSPSPTPHSPSCARAFAACFRLAVIEAFKWFQVLSGRNGHCPAAAARLLLPACCCPLAAARLLLLLQTVS